MNRSRNNDFNRATFMITKGKNPNKGDTIGYDEFPVRSKEIRSLRIPTGDGTERF